MTKLDATSLLLRTTRKGLRSLGELLSGWGGALSSPSGGVGLTAWERAALAANAELKRRHCSKRCFVVAGGRSARDQDPERLAAEITIFADRGERVRHFERWQFSYAWRDLDSPVIPRARQYFGLGWLSAARTGRAHPAEGGHVLLLDPHLSDSGLASVDLTRPLPGRWSNLELSLALALFLGCDPIYLIGFEHDWLAFPAASPEPGAPLGREYWERILFAQERWAAYRRIRELANVESRRVLNASPGSFLEVFEKATLEQALSGN